MYSVILFVCQGDYGKLLPHIPSWKDEALDKEETHVILSRTESQGREHILFHFHNIVI